MPTGITLDAQDNPNAVFVFVAGSTINLASGQTVTLINGAKAQNVYFVAGTSFTSVATSTVNGNILAVENITLGGGVLNGYARANTGVVAINGATAITVTTSPRVGSSYSANAVIGSLVLAQPGQIALVESLTTDSVATGTPLSLAVQLDEIAPVSSGYFESLLSSVPDPTELEPSNSLYAQRFYLSQTQQPAVCRHLQVEVSFGTDTVQNELLSMTLFGGFEQEK
jgi:hypothetical protein